MRRWIAVTLLFITPCLISAFDRTEELFPETQFKSVNSMSMTTNREYNITPVGSADVYSQQTYKPQPRRVPKDPQDPFLDPIGDAPILLFIGLAAIYAAKKKEK